MRRFRFVHLNVHSHYSILDGCASIVEIVNAAIKDRMPGIAITDNSNMFGIMDFFNHVTRINRERMSEGKKPFKPIIGCALYVSEHGCRVRKDSKDTKSYHLTVLAKNLIGYKNLIKIVSHSWTDGFYMSTRTDRIDLERYHEGLIVLSGGFGSEVYTKIANDDMTGLDETIEWYKQTFTDDYYLELQRNVKYDLNSNVPKNQIPEQQRINTILMQKAKEHGVKVVATNDVRYVKPRDLTTYNIQRCKAAGKTLDEFTNMIPLSSRWLKSRKEMSELFADIPEAIFNTMEIFDKIEFYNIRHAPMVPSTDIPREFGRYEDKKYEYLRYLSYSKAKQIYGEQLPDKVSDRLNFELKIIKQCGLSDYFLFLQEVVNAAQRELGVWIGSWRGSAAGCLVNYCLGITKIDPLQYGLLFECFIRPESKALPYIYLALDWEGRLRVVDWLKQKYGEECCAYIVTFDKYTGESAFDTVTQVMQIPESVSSPITKALLSISGWYSLGYALRFEPEVRKAVRKTKMSLHNVFERASTLQGRIYRTGVHPDGIVVSDEPISNLAPLMTAEIEDKEGNPKRLNCVQYGDYWDVDEAGLVWFDISGLNTLSIMKETIEKIRESKGINIDIEQIPIDDTKTFELFQNGMTEDILQFEMQWMRKLLIDFHPICFEDLVILNGKCCFSPCPEEYIEYFATVIKTIIKHKNSGKPIKYTIPCMEKYLHNTYGVIIYIEQAMQISCLISNFTRSESDMLRKALFLPQKDVLATLKTRFIEGGIKNGHTKKTLEKVWRDIERNNIWLNRKAHIVCRTWLAYQMAYLKANYPEEFGKVIERYNLDCNSL